MAPQVGFVTGGASGMGLAVVEDLVAKGWNIAIFDFDAAAGAAVAEKLGKQVLFIQGNVVKYEEQAAAFLKTFQTWGQIDFVFANAGIGERGDIYAPAPEGPEGWPAQPNTLTLDVDMNGVVWTCYLALHFLRKNASKGGWLVMTASSAALYPSGGIPLYAAAKHGVVGLTRAMGQMLKLRGEPISVNCLCPGVVPTGLMPQTVVDIMPQDMVTWPSTIVKAVNGFLADASITGQAAECSGQDVIYRPPYEPQNDAARFMLTGKWITDADSKQIDKHNENKAEVYSTMEKS